MSNYENIEEPSIEEIENELFNTTWREDAKELPHDYLTSPEQEVIQKYIEYKPLTEKEVAEVKMLLRRYRPALIKEQPQETINRAVENINYVNDEKAFLQLVDEQDQIQTIPFTFKKNNKEYRMHFDIYPVTDSQAILDIQNNLSMFKDLTEEEAQIYQKVQSGQTLTREEEQVRQHIQDKIEQATQQNTKQIIIEYLSMQLTFTGKASCPDCMKKVFKRVPLVYLAVLFQKVQEINNIADVKVDQVFQEFNH